MSCEMVLVPRWKLLRAAEILERDGDEHGVANDIRDMLRVRDALHSDGVFQNIENFNGTPDHFPLPTQPNGQGNRTEPRER